MQPNRLSLLPHRARMLRLPLALALLLGTAGCSAARAEPHDGSASLAGTFLAYRAAVGTASWEDADRLGERLERLSAGQPVGGELPLGPSFFFSALAAGDFARAHKLADHFVTPSSAPGNPDAGSLAAIVLAVDALADDRPADAEAALEKLRSDAFGMILGPLVGAWVSYAKEPQQYDQAMQKLQALRDRPEFQAIGLMAAARLAEVAGRVPDAEQIWAELVRKYPVGRVFLAKAAFETRRGRADAARADLEAGQGAMSVSFVHDNLLAAPEGHDWPDKLDVKQGAAASILELAPFLLGNREDPAAGFAILRLSERLAPDNPNFLLALAEAQDRIEQHDSALATLARIPASSPYATTAAYERMNVLAQMGRLEEAEALAAATVSGAPDQPVGYIMQAELAQRARAWPQAETALRQALGHMGSLAGARARWPVQFRLAVALEQGGKWPEARRLLTAITAQTERREAVILNYLGYALADRNEDLPQARVLLRDALRLEPQAGYIVDSWGWLLYREGKIEEALTAIEEAADLDPSDAEIREHLGDLYWKAGHPRDARFAWAAAQRLLELDPEQAAEDAAALGRLGLKQKSGLEAAESATRREAERRR